MAYAALVSLAKTIHLILNHHQNPISTHFRNQIKSIYKNVTFLQAVLLDSTKRTNTLEDLLRELAYKAEDIVEVSWAEKIKGSSAGYSDLEKVTKEVEAIVKDLKDRHKEAVVGFDGRAQEIHEQLIRDSSRLEVIPIVGMPGIGKTTLAKYVYEDDWIKKHFDVKAWAGVSQNYDLPSIVSSLRASMGLSGAKNASMEEDTVYKSLFGRRYLIVLDDIWSCDAWDCLQHLFPDNANGSRIMFTTRLLDVATYVDSSTSVHEMHLMDEDSSWDLLRRKIFGDGPCPQELESIGRTIATSCRGLPLAIVVIAGLLAVDRSKFVDMKAVAAWEKVAENVKSAISENDRQFYKVLALSFTHLPHHLRPLFMYLGGFPEDYEMRVSRLIKLWVSEGFLKQSRSGKALEEVAKEYLEDLVKRNLVLVVRRKSNGGIKSFSLHDMMREMCVREVQKRNFFLHVRGVLEQGAKILRRVSIVHSDLDFIHGSSVHTVLCLDDRRRGNGSSLRHCRLLRILDLIDAKEYFSSSTCLPDYLFELFHLRYLALGYPFSIPAAIANLRNLQTLTITSDNHHKHLVHLPEEIWKLPQLRHILIVSCVFPSQGDFQVFALENLQTLCTAVNFVCSEKIIEKIPNMKKLGISYNEETYGKDYELCNLPCFQTLESLKIEFVEKQNSLLSLAFPKTLKNLSLSSLGLPWEDIKIVSLLPSLQVLKLRGHACVGESWETTEGEFPRLEFLLIDQSRLQHWIVDSSSHFPRLKFLVLHHCRRLMAIPESIGDIPTLELIEVDDCNGYLLDSATQMQDYLNGMYGTSLVQVRVVEVSEC